MPDRPSERNLATVLNGLLTRVRSLEDNRRIPPRDVWFDGTCTAVRGEGEEVDPYQVDLRFDPDPNNQIECREEGLFVGGGQSVGWDAVVDASIVASVPDSRLFQGIGEALDHLATTVGLTSAGVAVRPGTYTETSSWDTPTQVLLFGIRGADQAGTGLFDGPPTWNWGGFTPIDTSDATMENLELNVGSATSFPVLPYGSLSLVRCFLSTTTSFPTTGSLCTFLNAYRSSFDHIGNSGTARTITSTRAVYTDCDINLRVSQTTTPTFVLAGTELIITGGRLFADGTSSNFMTLNLPADVSIRTTNSEPGTTTSVQTRRFVCATGTRGSIHMIPSSDAGDTNWDVVATNSFNSLELTGSFRNITASGAHNALTVFGACYDINGTGTWDITGPAVIGMSAQDVPAAILRGNSISGHISVNGLAALSSGTFLSFVGADFCNIQVAANGANTSGTYKSYSFDANCDKNILTFAGDSTFPVAGTDAGTANLVTVT